MSKVEEAKQRKNKKKKMRLVFRSSILLVLLAAVVFVLVSNFNKDKTVIGVGADAPNFKLQQMNGDGGELALDDLKGKGVMLNFWATYCGPCKDEMPYMESLYPEYKEKGVEILAVSLDSTDLVVDRFIDDYELSFPIVRDNGGQVLELYDVGELPSTLFINENGEVVEKVSGPLSLDRLEGYLQQIVPQ
ncbi:thiol-disulfide oxidoreductase ResA [Sediminibacillus albus]|uniref:Peroxiredoxin n=1 Tax=Sediminibacillus albus TaxID=407036 RepID=A0A1G8VKZ7_9BACI|nr:thiol-disulfide oxidoreductase ResA [Sediminibacillus albus]SDJ66624.1 Peroxiredoxin [Sediminibacillus albus]